jgi:drug/metabolite transporter (DMT)-like permease
LALLFAHPRRLAFKRLAEFVLIAAGVFVAIWKFAYSQMLEAGLASLTAVILAAFLWRRIRRAHFDWLSNVLAVFGLPLFAILLLNSDISHKRGSVKWKGREYGASVGPAGVPGSEDSEKKRTGKYN